MKTALVSLTIISTAFCQEMWYNVDGTKFGFDKLFRKNLEEQNSKPNNSEKKK
jgi:hypothetical protein